MPTYIARVGNVELVSLTDGGGVVPPQPTFPESSIGIWRSEYPELLDEEENIHPRYGSVAIRSAGKLIVVDTGLGQPDGTLLNDMKRKGVDREAVDIVFLTHLHGDHVGWNLSDGKPTFPRARYIVPRADWEFWTKPSMTKGVDHIRDQVRPLEELKLMDLVENDYDITSELRAVGTPGHTPGHMSVAISSSGERGYILGDLAHSPAQAHYTRWNPVFDIDHIQSRETRAKAFDELESDGSLISGGHYPDPGFGRLIRVKGRRIWQGV